MYQSVKYVTLFNKSSCKMMWNEKIKQINF